MDLDLEFPQKDLDKEFPLKGMCLLSQTILSASMERGIHQASGPPGCEPEVAESLLRFQPPGKRQFHRFLWWAVPGVYDMSPDRPV